MMLPRISTAKQRLSVKESKESEFFMCACTITELLESSFFLFVEKWLFPYTILLVYTAKTKPIQTTEG